MEEKVLNSTRTHLIDSLISFSTIFVMVEFIQLKDLSWWRYVIGIAAYGVFIWAYRELFNRFIRPTSDLDTNDITKSKKFLSYLGMFVILMISAIVYSFLPFGLALNLTLTTIVNFALTMSLCYYIAKA